LLLKTTTPFFMTYLKDLPDFSKVKKVLLIKLRHLGDVVLSTPVISVLKNRYPHLEIDMLINEEGKELVEGLEAIQKVILYKRTQAKKNFFSKLSVDVALFNIVRKEGYDLVINLTEGDKGNLLALISRARYKVGQEGSSFQNQLTHLYKRSNGKRHIVDKNLDALRRLGIYPESFEKKLLIPDLKNHEQDLDKILNEQGIKDYIVLHPVSRWMYKSPRVKTFIEVIKKLDCTVLITGSNDGLKKDAGSTEGFEESYIREILENCPNALFFPTGRSIKMLSALLKKAQGLISVDTLPLHIASCLKIPTVSLFGPTSEIDWGPWDNPQATVVTYDKSCRACYKDGCGGGKLSDCLEDISPEQIIQACQLKFQGALSR
jgi:heptosyltransferase III